MNKKVAAFLFAIGVGSAATVSAFQQNMDQCGKDCSRVYRACLSSDTSPAQCLEERVACSDRCGI
ncbi:hypothetical protein IFU01_20045 [Oxalobacteraceae sp. CFBP 8763]|jgi:hypothetical protein|nr:hypothetical protein [Oxalobacteraceae sp. CFBP 8763]